jgi:C1A family cysteine protease
MNWLDGMFAPDRCGNLALTGNVQGGHAESIVGYDATADAYYLQNHWDNDWGICLGAHCGYHVLTGAQLFSTTLDADFVQPVQ